MKFLLIPIFIFFNFNLFAQLHFQFCWGTEPIVNSKKYVLNEKDSISFSELKLYLSNFIIKSKDVALEINEIDLIENDNEESKIILDSIQVTNFNTLIFTFGLDSSTNTSGILTEDLDPVNGMYWAWNSGYIHLRMIGNSSIINTSKELFQYHLGGYRNPNQTNFPVSVSIKGNILKFDLKPIFTNHIQLDKKNNLMIPGKEAHEISKFAASLFSTE